MFLWYSEEITATCIILFYWSLLTFSLFVDWMSIGFQGLFTEFSVGFYLLASENIWEKCFPIKYSAAIFIVDISCNAIGNQTQQKLNYPSISFQYKGKIRDA